MKQALIGTAISLLLSACLYFGQGSLHQFAFYVAAATNVLCWLLIFAGGIKGQGAANLLARPWLSIPTGALHVAALALTCLLYTSLRRRQRHQRADRALCLH